MTIRCRAPGKIILSGEHAVVHGCPALVTAVDRYATATLTPIEKPRVEIELPTLEKSAFFTLPELEKIQKETAVRYQEFLTGTRDIQDVISDPLELLACAVVPGVRVHVDSEIPIGAGMGSSAAILTAMLQCGAIHKGQELSRDELERETLKLERYQHGHPSGVDPAVCVHGGMMVFKPDGRHRQSDALQLNLAFTGKPESTTGECVEHVRKAFADDAIWREFERVTLRMAACLREDDEAGWLDGVRENHRLLVRIGVVPKKVQEFVEGVETKGGAAKICGAGSIRGDAGGMVMMCGELEVCEYECMTVKGGIDGVDVL